MKTIIITIMLITLTACGQKGALYLPQKPQVNPQAPSVEKPSEMTISDDPNDY